MALWMIGDRIGKTNVEVLYSCRYSTFSQKKLPKCLNKMSLLKLKSIKIS